VAGPCQVDKGNFTTGGLNDDLVLRQCPSHDLQTDPVQYMPWAQFQKEFRPKTFGLFGVRTEVEKWVVEAIVIQPPHAPTIDRHGGSARWPAAARTSREARSTGSPSDSAILPGWCACRRRRFLTAERPLRFSTMIVLGVVEDAVKFIPVIGDLIELVLSLLGFYFHRIVLVTDQHVYVYRDLPFHRPGKLLMKQQRGPNVVQIGSPNSSAFMRFIRRGQLTFQYGTVVYHGVFWIRRARYVAQEANLLPGQ
jgi:hypothetical protein